jgi:hypothetical protein
LPECSVATVGAVAASPEPASRSPGPSRSWGCFRWQSVERSPPRPRLRERVASPRSSATLDIVDSIDDDHYTQPGGKVELLQESEACI